MRLSLQDGGPPMSVPIVARLRTDGGNEVLDFTFRQAITEDIFSEMVKVSAPFKQWMAPNTDEGFEGWSLATVARPRTINFPLRGALIYKSSSPWIDMVGNTPGVEDMACGALAPPPLSWLKITLLPLEWFMFPSPPLPVCHMRTMQQLAHDSVVEEFNSTTGNTFLSILFDR